MQFDLGMRYTASRIASRVALGVARAAAIERRVAIADLVGAPATLGALAGDGDAPGITDSFLHGVSLE